MLTIRCQCGELYHAEESHVGRAIKCRRCDQIVCIGTESSAPSSPRAVEADTPIGGRTVLALWSVPWWAKVALASIALLTMLLFAARFFTHENEQQQPVTLVPAPQPPAEIELKPTPVPKSPPPPTPKAVVNRLTTGTNISIPQGPLGRGKLRIQNGTSYDAAVELVEAETNTTRRFVYIKAREETSLGTIAPCQCRLLFALGTDWDRAAEQFRDDTSYFVFDDSLRFNETKTEGKDRWMEVSVTLHAVPEGKAKLTRLSKQDFDRQRGRRPTSLSLD